MPASEEDMKVGYADSESGAADPMAVNYPGPSTVEELAESFDPVKSLFMVDDDPFLKYRNKTNLQRAKIWLFSVIPIFEWLSDYKLSYLAGDIVGGLTIASLAVPQVRMLIAVNRCHFLAPQSPEVPTYERGKPAALHLH